jgi:hypothetical protein
MLTCQACEAPLTRFEDPWLCRECLDLAAEALVDQALAEALAELAVIHPACDGPGPGALPY